jgi:hypothetical protein
MNIQTILKAYRPSSRYLISALITDDKSFARGEFRIKRSCYIRDTGHLNLVDMQICVNQLGLYAVSQIYSKGFWDSTDMLKRTLLEEMNLKVVRAQRPNKPFYVTMSFQKSCNSRTDCDKYHSEIEFHGLDAFASGFAKIAVVKTVF